MITGSVLACPSLLRLGCGVRPHMCVLQNNGPIPLSASQATNGARPYHAARDRSAGPPPLTPPLSPLPTETPTRAWCRPLPFLPFSLPLPLPLSYPYRGGADARFPCPPLACCGHWRAVRSPLGPARSARHRTPPKNSHATHWPLIGRVCACGIRAKLSRGSRDTRCIALGRPARTHARKAPAVSQAPRLAIPTGAWPPALSLSLPTSLPPSLSLSPPPPSLPPAPPCIASDA